MRELIIKRIRSILEHSSPQEMRWEKSWWDKDYNHVGVLNKRVMAKVKPTHLFQLDWDAMPDDKLVFFFEYVVHTYYKQYG